MQSEANHAVLTTIQLGVSTMFITATSEIASIACLHDFSGPALLSCSKILTYQLLGSQLWTALPLEKSRSPATANKVSKSRHNSRTKLRVKLSHDQNRDNIEFYRHCKFQSLPFCVRRRNGATDRMTDRQHDYSMPRGSALGIMTDRHTTRLLYAPWLRPPRHKYWCETSWLPAVCTMQIQWLHLSNQKPSSADHTKFSWVYQLSMCMCVCVLVEDSLLLELITLARLILHDPQCCAILGTALSYRVLRRPWQTVSSLAILSKLFKVTKL